VAVFSTEVDALRYAVNWIYQHCEEEWRGICPHLESVKALSDPGVCSDAIDQFTQSLGVTEWFVVEAVEDRREAAAGEEES
jgi:hypothetical protein